MAEGRMLRRKISHSKQVARLIALVDQRMGAPHGAYAGLLFTWCIAHLDVEGRMHGDPLVVKSMVAPLLPAVTAEAVEAYLRAAVEVGLVLWYEAREDQWLSFPGFGRSQTGLRKDKEAKPDSPAPEDGKPVHMPPKVKTGRDAEPPKGNDGVTPEEVRTNAGAGTDQLPEKGREEKGREEKALSRTHDPPGTEQGETSAPSPPPSWTGEAFELLFARICESPPGGDFGHEKSGIVGARKVREQAVIEHVEPAVLAPLLLAAYCEMNDDAHRRSKHHGGRSAPEFCDRFPAVVAWHKNKRPGASQQPAEEDSAAAYTRKLLAERDAQAKRAIPCPPELRTRRGGAS